MLAILDGRLHPGGSGGEERRDHQVQEESRTALEQSQPSRHGKAAPRPLPRRLAEGVLSSRGIRRGAAQATDHKRVNAKPSALP
jgi:hypothetical protein